MKTRFFVQRHPIEGEMGFEVDGEVVRFFCHWPFDRLENDFIQISNVFPIDRYRDAVRRLGKLKRSSVRGMAYGGLKLRLMSPGVIELNVVDANKSSPSEFQFPLNARADQLLPPTAREAAASRGKYRGAV